MPVAWASSYILLLANILSWVASSYVNWEVLFADSQGVTVSRLCQFLVSVQLGLNIGIEKFGHGKIPVSVSKDFVSEKEGIKVLKN